MSELHRHTFSMAVCLLFLRALSYSLTVHILHWFDGLGELYCATSISVAFHEIALEELGNNKYHVKRPLVDGVAYSLPVLEVSS